MPSDKKPISAAVLGRLMMLQAAIQAAPDNQRLAESVAAMLCYVPGVGGALTELPQGITARTGDALSAEVYLAARQGRLAATGGVRGYWQYELSTSRGRYGLLLLSLTDANVFRGYAPYVANAANLLALHLENEDISSRLQALNCNLGLQLARQSDSLRHTEERFQRLFETMAQGVVYQDSDGTITAANAAAQRILGLSFDELTGRTSVDPSWHSIHEDGTPFPGAEHPAMVSLRSGRPVNGVVMGLSWPKSGEVRWILIDAIPEIRPGDEQPSGVFTTFTEITERKRFEQELQASEQRWQFALEGGGEGVWDWDMRSGDVLHSRKWLTMFGRDGESQSGPLTEWLERVHPDEKEQLLNEMNRLRAGGTPAYRAEYRVRSADGGWRWVLARGQVVERSASGEPVRMIGTHVDITALKQADEERERLRAQFLQAQKMETIGRLAGGVAHDFNNLLTVINGYASLVSTSLPPGDPLRQAVEEIERAGERATGLVRQLLTFSRKEVAHREVLDLNELVRHMRNLLERMVGEDVRIETRYAAQPAPVLADRGQLEQVLMNLVVNARDAMPSGGTLAIECSVTPKVGRCTICDERIATGDYVGLAVRDSGSGMDEEVLEHLFEPFFTTKPVGKGTGLGLSVVHGIVTQNHGHISVESRPGEGTEFKVYFPLVTHIISTSEPSRPAASRGSATVLLVEDEADVRRYVVRVLSAYGYKVIQASDATEALAKLASQAADILLTDVVMPGVSGPELAAQARLSCPGLCVLFMSGYSGDRLPDLNTVEADGGFIQKPFTPQELVARVADVLAAGRV